jgi:hypothetical protein
MKKQEAFILLRPLLNIARSFSKVKSPIIETNRIKIINLTMELEHLDAVILGNFLPPTDYKEKNIWQIICTSNLLSFTGESILRFYNELCLKLIPKNKISPILAQLPIPLDLIIQNIDPNKLTVPETAMAYLNYLLQKIHYVSNHINFAQTSFFARKNQHSQNLSFVYAQKLYQLGVSFATITALIDKRMTNLAIRNRIRSNYYRRAKGFLSALNSVQRLRRIKPQSCINNLSKGDFMILHLVTSALFMLHTKNLPNNIEQINICVLLTFFKECYNYLKNINGLPKHGHFTKFENLANMLSCIINRICIEKEEFVFESYIPYGIPHYIFTEMPIKTQDYLHAKLTKNQKQELSMYFRYINNKFSPKSNSIFCKNNL